MMKMPQKSPFLLYMSEVLLLAGDFGSTIFTCEHVHWQTIKASVFSPSLLA